MLFHLKHRLRYVYAAPATLDCQIFRLRPRADGNQKLFSHHLSVTPEASLLSQGIDEFGNVETRAWFLGEVSQLTVEAQSTVETTRVNPYDFLIEKNWMTLPWGERALEARSALSHYLPPVKDLSLLGFAEGIRKDAGGEVLPFVIRLNNWMHERITKETRLDGPPRSPAETILMGRGACRDLTVAFMALARSQGIPSRFVTGYHEGDPENPRKELHAWAEVFLPGGGWRGFDPSLGLAVADRHIALACAPEAPETAVVTGIFSSTKAGSQLETEVLFLDETA